MISKKDYDFGVVIMAYYIDTNSYYLYLDVSIEDGMIEIYNLNVSIENDSFKIEIADVCDLGRHRNYTPVKFMDHSKWEYIKNEIRDDLKRTPWVLEYFKDGD